MNNHSWRLQDLIIHCSSAKARINDKWVPLKPLGWSRKYASLPERIYIAWKVFRCELDTFKWDEGQ